MARYAQSIDRMPAAEGPLYPCGKLALWNLDDAAVAPSYSFSLTVDVRRLRDKLQNASLDGADTAVAGRLVSDLQNMAWSPLSNRYCVGGRGYTHSILNYGRILADGLPEYGARIERGLATACTPEARDFHLAARETFAAVLLLLRKAAERCGSGPLKKALAAAAWRPPRSFREALVLINFMFYIDGCDSVGALDRCLSPFYRRDREAGALTPEAAEELLHAFFTNVDANSGWHMILGGEGADESVTVLCLRALKTRRPNSGLKITADTSDAVWAAAFDALRRGLANPAFYNDQLYRAGAVEQANVAPGDLHRIAHGGCTEFMIEGCSNVGSIDAGLNLLRVLDGTMRERLCESGTFVEFMDRFKADIREQVATLTAEVDLNQHYKALYRPQLVRTLFIDDCLDRAVEYNRGGARYNGGVINVAGIANVANALVAIRGVLDGSLGIGKQQLLDALARDYEKDEGMRQRLLALPKFGNRLETVDAIAEEITAFTFAEIAAHRCWRGNGFFLPSTIMFTTYVQEGEDIGATPDGRRAGTPIADSCGPMQGTDTEGPTSMLASVTRLPLARGLGTMVLNLRVSAGMLATAPMRSKLKGLIRSCFAMGGLQIQLSVLDREQLADALKHPEKHETLVVRVGGYTEYFNRLSAAHKHEIAKRTEFA